MRHILLTPTKNRLQGLPDPKRWNMITGMDYNKTKSKKKDELGDQVTIVVAVVVVMVMVNVSQ